MGNTISMKLVNPQSGNSNIQKASDHLVSCLRSTSDPQIPLDLGNHQVAQENAINSCLAS